ncbi:MAG: HAD-IA family hydrolase [Actinomycetia bacterium]|nr:HAD-IA family hydrolase [Actinomycetes bacterium]MCP5035144.1 HAD-IA family hydrolase [Actinomycetes bacterium]
MVQVALFDLGGVIVDLSGLDQFLTRHGLDTDEFMPRWLGLGAGNDFESGTTSADEFAGAFLDEFALSLSRDQFLTEFAQWPSGLLPGASELVDDLDVVTATLSNTNPIHWNSDFTQRVLIEMFDRHFPSFELGLAKPSVEVFERTVQLLDVEPGEVAFVDDNEINVEAAQRAGLVAFHARGPREARAALATLPSLCEGLAG